MHTESATTWSRIKGLLFHLFPHHLVSRITYRLTRVETPLKNPIARLFIRAFKVDMTEAAQPDITQYRSFNEFFVRPLKPGARPVSQQPGDIVCPADGRISQIGEIRDGRIFQAKGQSFTAEELLGSSRFSSEFRNGKFCTIYLSPRDYHRVHMPLKGLLKQMIHIPGRLFSVAPYATRVIPRLFARNERVAAIFDTDHGLVASVMVGAVNVSAIEMVWHGLVTPPAGKQIHSHDYTDHKVELECGAEMGRFNMGSTVILLFADSSLEWNPDLLPDTKVNMGQTIGRVSITRKTADFAGDDYQPVSAARSG